MVARTRLVSLEMEKRGLKDKQEAELAELD